MAIGQCRAVNCVCLSDPPDDLVSRRREKLSGRVEVAGLGDWWCVAHSPVRSYWSAATEARPAARRLLMSPPMLVMLWGQF